MEYYEGKISIRAWAEEDRPRERLALHGRRHLTEAELIAILIGSGSRNETAVELSRRILKAFNNDLGTLGKASVNELSKFKGIGQAKAITIIAALELSRRRKDILVDAGIKVRDPHEVYHYMLPQYADLNHEEFWIVLLNRANFIISRHLISKGGQAATVVDPKIIFKIALENNAAYIILTHNHPSGQLRPSSEDINITKRLVEAGRFLDLRISDHLIITNHTYFSFADEGLIVK